MALTSEILSFGGGVLTGLLTNVIWDQRNRLRRSINKLHKRKPETFGFSSFSADLFPINQWTINHPLERKNVKMSIATERPPTPPWLEISEWNQLVRKFADDYGGDTAYLTDFVIDHRESPRGQIFHYTVTPCDYSEHLATAHYLESHPEIQTRIRETLMAGQSLEFARTSPPSLIKVNVAVLDRDDRFLAVQRSGAVHSKKGLWTVGPNETMKLAVHATPGTRTEDLFGLSERCLREEVGLEPSDYGEISISWIGYEASTASVKIFAQVATTLAAGELVDHIKTSHSLFEMQDATWLPLNRRTLMDIIHKWEGGDSAGRVWSSSAPVSLQELWRMRRALHPSN